MNIRGWKTAIIVFAVFAGCQPTTPTPKLGEPEKKTPAPFKQELIFVERDELPALWVFSKTNKLFLAPRGTARSMSLVAGDPCDVARRGLAAGATGCTPPTCRRLEVAAGAPLPALSMSLREVVSDLENGQGMIFDTEFGPVISIEGSRFDAIEMLADFPIERLLASAANRSSIILASTPGEFTINRCFKPTFRIPDRVQCQPITGCGTHTGPSPRALPNPILSAIASDFASDCCKDVDCEKELSESAKKCGCCADKEKESPVKETPPAEKKQ